MRAGRVQQRAAALCAALGVVGVLGVPSYVLPKNWECAAGRYTTMTFYDGRQHLKCVECPAGKYQDKPGADPCRFCAPGKRSKPERKGCWVKLHAEDCEPGKWKRWERSQTKDKSV